MGEPGKGSGGVNVVAQVPGAQFSSQARRRWLSGGAGLSSVAGVAAMASRQVHPGLGESVLSSVGLLVGLLAGVIILPLADVRRITPVAAPLLIGAAAAAVWKPTNLVLFSLLLNHPGVFLMMTTALMVRSLGVPGGRWPSRVLPLCVLLTVAALLWSALSVLIFAGVFVRTRQETARGTRIDIQQNVLPGLCESYSRVLRVGEGFDLREQHIGTECSGSPEFIRGSKGNRGARDDALVCTARSTHEEVTVEFDPATLAGADAVDHRCR